MGSNKQKEKVNKQMILDNSGLSTSDDEKTYISKSKTELKQTRLNFAKQLDRINEIKEVCNLIMDIDIRRCAYKLLNLAEKIEKRKISRAKVLKIIMISTGRRDRYTVIKIFKRMRKYEIYTGCENGFSIIIRKPSEIKNFLVNGFLENFDENNKDFTGGD